MRARGSRHGRSDAGTGHQGRRHGNAADKAARAEAEAGLQETGTIVVPGQNSWVEESPAMPAGIAGTEPSVSEESPQSGAKSTADLSVQTGTPEAQIVDEPAAASTDVNAPAAILSVDAVPV